MRPRRGVPILIVLLAGGCGTPAAGPPAGAVYPGLVMAGDPAWRLDAGGWEYGRNDAVLNAGRAPFINQDGWTEERSLDRTRTTNGRARDNSATFVRTYRRTP